MPIYVYRCLDCGLSHEIRHGFDETYDGVCDACRGVVRKYFGEVHISASATPTRGMHEGKAIDWSGSKAKERDKERDFKFRKDFEEALNKESYQTLFNYVDGLGLDD